ncbi:molybdopterin-binding protein [Massilia sp. CF038]|uniref:competence/damage-inducible protein A n=1 Tax=Massilia sp. CF038 TaxID=1881045 RepID=UPI00091C319C|nr:molybdopterin-binding protein [Massilia sp. CF038]SHH21983.1 Predicted nucleotide-utilizing enzyme [Massilia sp. CF038]
MAFGLIIIGDEILSGKRQDQHFAKVVALLAERGLQLAWAEYLGDDPARISATLARTMASGDIVFSCGGIGATPDDHTRQAAAQALGLPLELHPEGKRLIQERIREMYLEAGKTPELDTPDNLHRLKMAEFPRGASLIPNPYNKVPGFTVGHHHFVPGFPVMAWPMIAWVLDEHYSDLFNLEARSEQSVLVFGAAESELTPLMVAIEASYAPVKVFSLPSVGDATTRRHIELGVKGEAQQTKAAFAHLCAELARMKVEFKPV